MSGWDVWLLALGLAMDCFAVSIASGVILKKVVWKPMVTMAFFFGLFQAAMPLIGWAGGNAFSHFMGNFDHWIAFAILGVLGFRMIRESLKQEDCREEFNPTSMMVILTLSVATSIDALAVGVSFAFLGTSTFTQILFPILIIGVVSFVMSLAGFSAGSTSAFACKLRAELWGGLILIVIGSKILIEHLFFQ